MTDLKDIKIGIGLVLEEKEEGLTVDFQRFLSDLPHSFHPRSTCFRFYHEDPLSKWQTILKAALFEDYRLKGLNYLLLISPPVSSNMQTAAIHKVVSQAIETKSKILRTPPGESRESQWWLLDMEVVRDYCRRRPEAQRFISGDSSSPLAVFENQLATLGYEARAIDMDALFSTGSMVPTGPFQLPREVQFFSISPAAADAVHSIEKINRSVTGLSSLLQQIQKGGGTVLYGAGTITQALLPLIKDNVRFIVDREPCRQGDTLLGVPVRAPRFLLHCSDSFDSIIITPAGRETQIRRDLNQLLAETHYYKRLTILDLAGNSEGPFDGSQPEPRADSPQESPSFSATFPRQPHHPAADSAVPVFLEGSPPQLPKTRERQLTKRGVLYVGYLCNIKCIFCYYAYNPAKKWHSLEQCKKDADLYRFQFGNESVDITGGEPTIYPHIFPLLDHCRDIGLKPTLITNMQTLTRKDNVKRFKDARVDDFLCSIHGYGDVYDRLTACKNGWVNILEAVRQLQLNNMKWRTNCTVTRLNMRQLRTIAEFAYKSGSGAINYIAFNPFEGWGGKVSIDFQPRHSEIQPYLSEALAYCDQVGLEANVRYFPFCQMKGHEEKCYNYSQLSYDPHEWDYCSWFSDKTQNPASKIPPYLYELSKDKESFHLFIAQVAKAGGFRQESACRTCALQFICDGLSRQYANRFGFQELQPYPGPKLTDPIHFIKNQDKII